MALDQIARLYAETQASPQCAICKSYRDIENALKEDQIALLITMEGAEPLGKDLDLLRVFYELGVRSIGLTHARTNEAGHGGIFASTGSSQEGLTEFGRDLVRECEALGVIIDLAHINPAGFNEILSRDDKTANCFAYKCPALLRYRAQHQRRPDQNDRGTTRCDWR